MTVCEIFRFLYSNLMNIDTPNFLQKTTEVCEKFPKNQESQTGKALTGI